MDLKSAGVFVIVTLLAASIPSSSIPLKLQGTSPGAFVGEGINALAVALLQDSQRSPAANVAFSPLGHAAVLAALAEGAEGSTQGELLAALRLPRDAPLGRAAYRAVLSRLQEKKKLNKPEFRSWFYVYKTAVQVEKNYADLLRDNYLMEVHDIDAPENELPSELADKRKPGVQQGSSSTDEELPEIPFEKPTPTEKSATKHQSAPPAKPLKNADIKPDAPVQQEDSVEDVKPSVEVVQQETNQVVSAVKEQINTPTVSATNIIVPATELLPPYEDIVPPAAQPDKEKLPEQPSEQQPAPVQQETNQAVNGTKEQINTPTISPADIIVPATELLPPSEDIVPPAAQPDKEKLPEQPSEQQPAPFQQGTNQVENGVKEQIITQTVSPADIIVPATELLPPFEDIVSPAAQPDKEKLPEQPFEQQPAPVDQVSANQDNDKSEQPAPVEKSQSGKQQLVPSEQETVMSEETNPAEELKTEFIGGVKQQTVEVQQPASELEAQPEKQMPVAEDKKNTEEQLPIAVDPQMPEKQLPVADDTQMPEKQLPGAEDTQIPEKQLPVAEVQQNPENQLLELQPAALETGKLNDASAGQPAPTQKEEPKPQVQEEIAKVPEKSEEKEVKKSETLPISEENPSNLIEPSLPLDSEMAESSLDAESREAISSRAPASPITAFNALYFRGAWATPFDGRQSTSFNVFPNESVPVNMLSTVGFFRIGDIPELAATAIELPYNSAPNRYSLLVLLPQDTEGALNKLTTSLSTRALRSLGRYMTERLVHVQIPEFEIGYVSYPQTAFRKLGIKAALDANLSEFPRISRSQRLFLQPDALAQLVRFRVDATSSSTNFLSTSSLGSNSGPAVETAPLPPSDATEPGAATRSGALQFRADRPFIFVLRDNVDKLTLVAGRIADPSSRPVPPLLP